MVVSYYTAYDRDTTRMNDHISWSIPISIPDLDQRRALVGSLLVRADISVWTQQDTNTYIAAHDYSE